MPARARWIPALILFVQGILFFRGVLFNTGITIPWDFSAFHLPLAGFAVESLRNGELPLWDPYTYCGRPMFANIQAQLFYPPTTLVLLLATLGSHKLLVALLEWQLALHVVLAGVFAYGLCRAVGGSRPAALIGATVFQMGGLFASQTQHLGFVNGAAWMPLAWHAVVRLREGWRWRWVAALSVALAMAVLAGMPAVGVIVAGSCLALAAGLVLLRLANPRLLPFCLLGFVMAGLLAAVQLLPTAQLNAQSIAVFRYEWLGNGPGLPLQSLVSLLLPNYYQVLDASRYTSPFDPTSMYLYSSIGGLLLAAGAVLRRPGKIELLWGGLAVLFALTMLGGSTLFGRFAFGLLPGPVRNPIYPNYALAAFLLGLGVLASLGADRLLKRPKLIWIALCVVSVDLLVVNSGTRLNAFAEHGRPEVAPDSFQGSRDLARRLSELTHATNPPSRLDTVRDSLSWSTGAALLKIPTANGYDPLALQRLIQVRLGLAKGERWGAWYQVENLDSPLLDLLNVRYVLSTAPLNEGWLASQDRWRRLPDLPGRAIYENARVLPRFFVVYRTEPAGDMQTAARKLQSPGFDPRTTAIVEGAPPLSNQDSQDTSAMVNVLEYKSSRIVLEVQNTAAGYLVSSETHYPGWHARVDGEEAPLYYTNVAFRGLPLPAGRHVVEMRFSPAILPVSAVVSITAWLMVVLMLRKSAGQGPKRSAPGQEPENQRQDDAQKNARDNGEVERVVLPADHNVTRQAPDPARQPPAGEQ